jgi:TolA-binding protein
VKANRCLWVPLLLLLVTPLEVLAQSSVDARMQKLEETIRALERRVAELETELREQKKHAPVPNDKVSWRKLQKGMSEGDVEKLLGSPEKIDVFGSFTLWHYNYPGGGQVQFDGRNRTVSSWHEP